MNALVAIRLVSLKLSLDVNVTGVEHILNALLALRILATVVLVKDLALLWRWMGQRNVYVPRTLVVKNVGTDCVSNTSLRTYSCQSSQECRSSPGSHLELETISPKE